MTSLLLMSFAEFQLPEWFSFGNAVSGLITLIGLIAAIIKLHNSQANSKATFGNLASILKSNIDMLKDTKNIVSDINIAVTTLIGTFDKVVNALEEQHKSNNNLATFIFECFSLSNLSDENKLKLKILYDQLFYKTDAEIINELRTAKVNIENTLLEKDKTITDLLSKVSDLTEKLSKVQAPIRKSRRVSN